MSKVQSLQRNRYSEFEESSSVVSLSSIKPCLNKSFHNNGHSEFSLDRMHKYFRSEILTDITINAGSHKIKAHRIVLCSVSEYFTLMFTSGLRESTASEVEMHDLDGKAVLDLIEYVYTGHIEFNEETVETILATASLLCIGEVVRACATFLERRLNASNCIGIQRFADAHSCFKLRDAALLHAVNNFTDVLKYEEFKLLPHNEVCELLCLEVLNIRSEETLFNGIILWIEYDKENRMQYMGELLSCVKLPLLSRTFLIDFVQHQVSADCQHLVIEALEYLVTLPEKRPKLPKYRVTPRKPAVGLLYAIGGCHHEIESWSLEAFNNTGDHVRLDCESKMEVYSPAQDEWKVYQNVPGQRSQMGVALLKRNIFLVGGRNDLRTVKEVDCFDLDSCSWSPMPALLTRRHGLGTAVMPSNGPLFAIGGYDAWIYLDSVEKRDSETGIWSYVAPMLSPRSTVGVGVLNNKIYAVGGRNSYDCLKTVEVYDPHTDKWIKCAAMSRVRAGLAVAVLDGTLYAVGGYQNEMGPVSLSSVERYDPRMDSWMEVAPLNHPKDGVGVAVLGYKIIAVGGYNGSCYLNVVEEYDAYRNEWTQLAPLNYCLSGPRVVTVMD